MCSGKFWRDFRFGNLIAKLKKTPNLKLTNINKCMSITPNILIAKFKFYQYQTRTISPNLMLDCRYFLLYNVTWFPGSPVFHVTLSLVPRLLPVFQCYMQKMCNIERPRLWLMVGIRACTVHVYLAIDMNRKCSTCTGSVDSTNCPPVG